MEKMVIENLRHEGTPKEDLVGIERPPRDYPGADVEIVFVPHTIGQFELGGTSLSCHVAALSAILRAV